MPMITAARYAAVTSTLALAVALGGTSYAAVKIGTQQLKNNAVLSSKIKNNSVTGADVKEKTLGLVPNADTSRYAADAGSIAGQHLVTVNATRGTAAGRPTYIYNRDGFRIEMRCLPLGGGAFAIKLAATTTAPKVPVSSTTSGPTIATSISSDFDGGTVRQYDAEDGTFDSSFGEFNLLDIDDGDTAQTTFTYRDSRRVVQGTLSTDVDLLHPTPEPCMVSGFIVASR